MRILAFSDVRSQPFEALVQAVEEYRPDLILYGGDDVERFGDVPEPAVAEAAVACLREFGGQTGAFSCRRGAHRHVEIRAVYPKLPAGAPLADARWVGLGDGFEAAVFPCQTLGLVSDRVDEVTETLLDLGALDPLLAKDSWPWRALSDRGRTRRFNLALHRISHIQTIDGAYAVYTPPAPFDDDPEGDWTALARKAPFGLAGVIGNDCHPLYRAILDAPPCHDLDAGPLILDDQWAVLGLGGASMDDASGIGQNLYTREEARAQLQLQLAQVGSRACVLVSHAPPQGVLDSAIRFGSEDIGSSVVRAALDDPRVRLVICGHVHLMGGRQATVGHCTVVNIASHDDPDAPLRWALITLNGPVVEVVLGQINSPDEIRAIWEIGPGRAATLHEHGVTSIEQLARTPEAELGRIIGPTFGKIARRHAATLLDGRPRRLTDSLRFPERVVYLDVETSHDNQDDPWLIGLLLPGEAEVRQLVELEPSRLGQQLAALDGILERYADHRIVRWGSFDLGALRKAVRKTGAPSYAWLDPRRWLDANMWLRRTLTLPTQATGLKDIASHLEFPWRHTDIDGMQVGIWYAKYRDHGRRFDVSKVREYNADDVHAVPYVIERVRRMFDEAG